VERIGTYLILVLSRFFNLIPKFILYRFADVFYIILFYLARYRKKVVYKNLRNSFPEKSDKEINRIAKKFYQHLSDTFTENCALLTMSKERVKNFIKIGDYGLLDDLYNKQKDVIGITGHYSNWEMFLVLPLISKHKVLGVYKPLNNKHFDKAFYKMRQKFGATPVKMHDTYKAVLQQKQNKQLTLLGLIADQRPQKKAGSYWTNFLNQDTVIYLGPEKVAKKLNASIVFLYLEKVKRGKYILRSKLLFEDPKVIEDHKITETHVRFLENMIKERPEFWLWSHNRWKHKR
jgi:KDO2-lipid IV(A) lauroyltransferase